MKNIDCMMNAMKQTFAIRNIPFDQGVTSESIKLFEQVNHRFGQFIQAKVNDRDFKIL